jgi:hypothetical protein
MFLLIAFIHSLTFLCCCALSSPVPVCQSVSLSVLLQPPCQDARHLSLNPVNFVFLNGEHSVPGVFLCPPGLLTSFLQQAMGVRPAGMCVRKRVRTLLDP